MQLILKLIFSIALLIQISTLKADTPPSKSIDTLHSLVDGVYSTKLMKPYQATIDRLQQKQQKYKHKSVFLKHMFYYVHRKHLKRYRQYSPLAGVVKTGTYDCVSASALYALLLEGLGFSYQIWEMDYHVYLSVELDNQTFVLETTNPIEGFIEHPTEIAEH